MKRRKVGLLKHGDVAESPPVQQDPGTTDFTALKDPSFKDLKGVAHNPRRSDEAPAGVVPLPYQLPERSS